MSKECWTEILMLYNKTWHKAEKKSKIEKKECVENEYSEAIWLRIQKASNKAGKRDRKQGSSQWIGYTQGNVRNMAEKGTERRNRHRFGNAFAGGHAEYCAAASGSKQAYKRAWKEKSRVIRAEWIFGGSLGFFRCEPSEVGKIERLKFISLKLSDGRIKGRISFYCSVLEVSRQEFYDYLDRKDKPWKYASLVEEMLKILGEDE